jgi:hypothetical protein
MSDTATTLPYSTAAGFGVFAGSADWSGERETAWAYGQLVQGHLELDVTRDDVELGLAAWNAASDRALLNCEVWE